MAGAETEVALGPFRVDFAETRLLRDGVPLELRPQAFRALEVLIRNHGKLVDYGQMIREAWGVQVSKHTVATTVNEVKSVLGEYGSWITCQPKFRLPADNASIGRPATERLALLEPAHEGRV